MRDLLPRLAIFVAFGGALFAAGACGTEGAASPSADAAGTAPEPADAATPTLPDAGDAGAVDTPIADASTDATADADDRGAPAVRFVGRFDTREQGVAKVAWPGARILARFSGTRATASMRSVPSYGGFDLWDVTVDGVLTKTITLTGAMSPYDLTGTLPAGVHTVELFKRTEGYVGTTSFGGFDFDGALLPPPPAPPRRIEFLGDSASDGYGIESPQPTPCTNTPETQNDHLAWPWLVAKTLGADHHNLSYGGRGVYWNYSRSAPDVFGVIYPRTLPDDGSSAWNFASFSPDVVWIALGGNDWDQPAPDAPPPPYASFVTAYASLVATIRAQHPKAFVVLSVPPSLNDVYPSGYSARTNLTRALEAVKDQSADPKIAVFSFTPSKITSADGEPDLTACNYHPNARKHAAMAAEAAAFLAQKMGW